MNKELIEVINKALNAISEAEEHLTTALKDFSEKEDTIKPAKSKSSVKAKSDNSTKPVLEKKEVECDDVTAEDLEAMSYNDLKSYAKEIGVKAVGSHKQLLNSILNAMQNNEEDIDGEEEPVKKSSKKSESKVMPKSKSVRAKVEEPDDEEEEEDFEEEDEDEEEDELSDIKAMLEDMEVEELADILREAGLSTKGKKEALITKILKGIEDGDIELEEDEDEEVDEDEDLESEDGDVEYDINDTENPDMTKERADAIRKLTKEIKADVKKKNLTEKEMGDALIELGWYNRKEVKGLSNLVDTYIDTMAMFINDEGEEVECEEPYSINGYPACCGRFLDVNENEDGYICSTCGAEYEADSEE